jgi:flagellar protein FlaG
MATTVSDLRSIDAIAGSIASASHVPYALRAANDEIPAPESSLGNGKPASDDLDALARALNDYVQQTRSDLRFEMDDQSGHVVIQLVDADSGEVLRQIPGEAALRVARHLMQHGWGLTDVRA